MNWISVPALQVEGRLWKNSKMLKIEQKSEVMCLLASFGLLGIL